MCEGQDLPSQDLEVRVNVTHQGLLSISTTSTLSLPTHDHCLQFSHLTSPWGPSVGTGPQWNPLIPPETGGVASNVDFFRGLLSLLSVSEVHIPNTPWDSLKYKKPCLFPYLSSSLQDSAS